MIKKTILSFLLLLNLINLNNSQCGSLAMECDPDEYSKYFFKGIALQEDMAFVGKITLKQWLAKPITFDAFFKIANVYNNQIEATLCDKNLWYNQRQPLADIRGILTSESRNIRLRKIQPQNIPAFTPVMPYIAKLVIPQKTKIISVSDQHGNMNTTRDILIKLNISNSLDDNMILANDTILIFKGDYTDRGPESIKVIATAMLLAIKNPGKVVLLRGNHEDIISNIFAYGLRNEINGITRYSQEALIIIRELSKAYEYMPLGVFVGYQGFEQTTYQFFVHGCIDIRINYSHFLDYKAEEFSQGGGICFRYLTLNDIMTPQEAIDFLGDIVSDSNALVNQFAAHFLYPCPAFGFLWNDIEPFFKEISKTSRGDEDNCLISMHPTLIMNFCAKCSTAKSKIMGIICGHNHSLPKKIDGLKKNSYDNGRLCSPYFVAIPEKCGVCSPRASSLISNPNKFSLVCFVSGSMISATELLAYPSTFLVTEIDCSGNWMLTPIFDPIE